MKAATDNLGRPTGIKHRALPPIDGGEGLEQAFGEDAIFEPDGVTFVRKLTAQRNATVLWGIGCCSPAHFHYDRQIVVLKRLVSLGATAIVLLADHDHYQSEPDGGDGWGRYWRYYLESVCGLTADYVLESALLELPGYCRLRCSAQMLGRLRLNAVTQVLPAAARRDRESPDLYSLLSPVFQCADLAYFQPDIVVADMGQAKFHKLGHTLYYGTAQPAFVYVPTACDIRGRHIGDGVSSACKRNACAPSGADRRVSLHEHEDTLALKIRKLHGGPPGVEHQDGKPNMVLDCLQWSAFPWSTQPLEVRTQEHGIFAFETFAECESAFRADQVHIVDLKTALERVLRQRLQRFARTMPQEVLSIVHRDRAIGRFTLQKVSIRREEASRR